MTGDLNIQHIGWACTLVGGFLCGLLTFWLLRPRPKRMPESPKPVPYASAIGSRPPAPWATKDDVDALSEAVGRIIDSNSEVADYTDNWRTHCEARLTALENQRPKPAPEPFAPVTREEYGMLVARLDRILGSAEREIERVTVAQDALGARIAALEAATRHKEPTEHEEDFKHAEPGCD